MKTSPAASSPTPIGLGGINSTAILRNRKPDARQTGAESNTHRDILASELDHCFKGALALVKSIVNRSRSVGQNDVDNFRPAGHVALQTHDTDPAGQPFAECLGTILKAEIAAFVSPGSDLVALSGPHLTVDESAGSALSRVCRELVACSMQYGVLSAKEGRILLSWMRDPGGDLIITWHEHGAASAQSGVDTFQLTRTLESQLGGHTDILAEPDGRRVILTVPQKHLMSDGAIGGDLTVSQSDSNGGQRRAVAPGDARVLVVEDNLVIGLDIEATLLDFGVREVVLVSSVDEALEVVQAGDLTTAVLDFDLGDGKSSLQLAELLAAARVPFVFLSGYSLSSELPDHLSSAPVLNKPVSIARLRSAVEQALSGDATQV